MKTKLALFFSLVALTAWAQTNEIRYPELVTKMRTFTNAHVGTVTAAWVTILDDSGGARVAITNLPDWLQKQLGYSPEKAVAQMKSESERRHRELAAKIEQEKFLASMATNATSIHVSALLDDYGLCEIESTHGIQRVYMVGLPARVSGYYQQHASLAAQIYDLENSTVTITSTARNTGDEAFDSQLAADNAAYEVRQNRSAQLQSLQGQLNALEKTEVRSTMIQAYFTGLYDNGMQRWRAIQ